MCDRPVSDLQESVVRKDRNAGNGVDLTVFSFIICCSNAALSSGLVLLLGLRQANRKLLTSVMSIPSPMLKARTSCCATAAGAHIGGALARPSGYFLTMIDSDAPVLSHSASTCVQKC